ncbi:MAG: prolyl oligopeptidase family serine peptidase, partial [Planctomycetota bacterium]
LIHVGAADARVPPEHARTLYRALYHYLGVPTELIVYPGQPHGLMTKEYRAAKMEWDHAWFKKYLKGEE